MKSPNRQFVLRRVVSKNQFSGPEHFVGYFSEPPQEGCSFYIMTDLLDPSIASAVPEAVLTSTVTSVKNIEGGWMFKTKNSVYTLTLRKKN